MARRGPRSEPVAARPRRLDRLLVTAICAGARRGDSSPSTSRPPRAGRRPTGDEEAPLALSMVAAGSRRARLPTGRERLEAAPGGSCTERPPPDEVLRASGRMTRSLPLDELLLQLAELLRRRSRSPRPRCGRAPALCSSARRPTPSAARRPHACRGRASPWSLAPASRARLASRMAPPAARGAPGVGDARRSDHALGRAVRAHRRRAGARRCLRRRGRARPRRSRAPGRPRSSQRTPRFGAAGVARAAPAPGRGVASVARTRRGGGGRRAAPDRAGSARRRPAALDSARDQHPPRSRARRLRARRGNGQGSTSSGATSRRPGRAARPRARHLSRRSSRTAGCRGSLRRGAPRTGRARLELGGVGSLLARRRDDRVLLLPSRPSRTPGSTPVEGAPRWSAWERTRAGCSSR